MECRIINTILDICNVDSVRLRKSAVHPGKLAHAFRKAHDISWLQRADVEKFMLAFEYSLISMTVRHKSVSRLTIFQVRKQVAAIADSNHIDFDCRNAGIPKFLDIL